MSPCHWLRKISEANQGLSRSGLGPWHCPGLGVEHRLAGASLWELFSLKNLFVYPHVRSGFRSWPCCSPRTRDLSCCRWQLIKIAVNHSKAHNTSINSSADKGSRPPRPLPEWHGWKSFSSGWAHKALMGEACNHSESRRETSFSVSLQVFFGNRGALEHRGDSRRGHLSKKALLRIGVESASVMAVPAQLDCPKWTFNCYCLSVSPT